MYDFLDKIGLKAVLEAIKGKIPTVSNPNLLINPDFKINQRGVVSGDTLDNGRYSLDRWRHIYNNLDFLKSINITSDGIELVTVNGAGNGYYGDFYQPFENPLPSGYYTISGKIDGVIRTFTGYLEGNADSVLFDGVLVLAHTAFGIRFYDDTRKIEWVKLEVGQVATQFVPPDSATELLKCQRYYQIRSSNSISAVDLRPCMRDGVNPTITALGNGNYAYSSEM